MKFRLDCQQIVRLAGLEQPLNRVPVKSGCLARRFMLDFSQFFAAAVQGASTFNRQGQRVAA